MAGLLDYFQRRTEARDPFATGYEANESRFASSPLSRDYYGGSAGASYRRQGEAYDRALRHLRRAARRGDVNSSLREIDVRNQAMAEGFTPGGIQSREERLGNMRTWLDARERGAANLGLAERIDHMGLEERWRDLTAPEREEERIPRGSEAPRDLTDPERQSPDYARFQEPADSYKRFQSPAYERFQSPVEDREGGGLFKRFRALARRLF